MSQPVLPEEIILTDAERLFIAESPPGLWPENQNSNFGALRKVLTSPVQDEADLVNELFIELFIRTAHGYLSLWEREYGLPEAPPTYSEGFRRILLLLRARKGPFTRTFRAQLVEALIRGTYGFSLELYYEGIPLTADGLMFVSDEEIESDFVYGLALVAEGVVLDAGGASLEASYYITENIAGMSYHVGIRSDFAPDMDILTRELDRITPSGISYTAAIES